MTKTARLNYRDVYSIEDNVKVHRYGDIHSEFLPTFRHSYRLVHGKSGGEEDQDDEEDESDSGEDDRAEPDVKLPANTTALWPWTANSHGQLEYWKGDTIVIMAWVDANWGLGRNARTGK